MASNVAVIHGVNSKVIRRIIVSDTDEELEHAVSFVPGEAVLMLPFDSCSKANDAAIRKAVEEKIGPPQPDRCVELDKAGNVVAIYHADPVLDKPTLHPDNVLELHATADLGDMKQGGEIVSMKPVPVQPTKDEMTIILKYKDGTPPNKQTWTADEAAILHKFGIEVVGK